MNEKDADAVEEVLPESALTGHGPEIAIGRGDDAHVECAIDNVTETANLLLLQDPKKLHLKAMRRVCDLIQE